MNKSKLVSKIAELVREKKLTEISDLRDESDRKGMRVVVELKNNCIPQVVLNKLFKHTQLQQGFGVIMLSLVDGVPRTLNVKEMLHYYIEHQKDVITRRTKYELRKAEERAHILEGYVIALDNIDEVIQHHPRAATTTRRPRPSSSSALASRRSRPTRSSRCACAA